jgi:trans-aconitate 2-methyltransferase
MSNWDGVEYRRVNTLQQWLADRALAGLDLEGVRSLLDIGCGDGRVTAAIAQRIPGADVVGIDPSPGMLSAAPKSSPVSFQVGDVASMEFEDAFDAVVSFNALHWVRDQHAALTRITEALHRPGRALLVFVCAGERPSLELVAMRVTQRGPWRRYFRDFTAPFVHPEVSPWIDTAGACGLNVTDVAVDDLSWDFGSKDAFIAWCAVGFGAWTSRLPSPSVTAFVSDVVEAYEAATGSAHIFRFMQLRAKLLKPGVER